jgi:hypothetical protein
MAHFAKLDANNIVTQVIVVANEDTCDAVGVEKEHIGAAFCEKLLGGVWKQTSYNANFRKHYAGIGFKFDADLNAFIPPKPNGYTSWLLDEETCNWKAPVDYPTDGKLYEWNETTGSWDLSLTQPEA